MTEPGTGPEKYGAILADPPWTYTFATRATEKSGTGWHGGAANHYATMTRSDLQALPVGELAQEDSMLWLWVVNPLIGQGLELMEAWGFQYKTMLTWAKLGKNGRPAFGMGYWLRGASEHVLIGTKGKVKPQRRDVVSWFSAERMKHSQKPPYVHELIESYTTGPYLELFARGSRPGWDCWGNELEGGRDVFSVA